MNGKNYIFAVKQYNLKKNVDIDYKISIKCRTMTVLSQYHRRQTSH